MHGITRDESLLLLTGETGSGKTTLCRAIIAALGERTFSSVLHQPYMTGPEMLRLMLRDFGMVSREDLRRGALAGADVPHLLEVVESFLRSLAAIQSRAIVIIDEAQSLSPTLLDEVRMLTAFERDGHRLIQIILCGQPMLLNTLKTEPMYALNERITRRVALTPLSPAEVEAYIYHRLAIAGGGDTIRFDADALKLIAELSRGLPRRVNVLADRTLQEGRVDSATAISASLVKRAAKSLAGVHQAAESEVKDLPPEPTADALSLSLGGDRPPSTGLRLIGVIALFAVAALGAGYWYFGNQLLTEVDGWSMPVRAPLEQPAAPALKGPPSDEDLMRYFIEMQSIRPPQGLLEIPRDGDDLD
jgi:type II secretory pathway predicted ATPase ExeA